MTTKQPTNAEEQELLDINSCSKSVVRIPNTKSFYKIGWLKPYTSERFTEVIVRSETEVPISDIEALNQMSIKSKVPSKAASIIILNGYFKIRLLYPILWRYLYFVKEYTYEQLFPIILEGKKKIPLEGYSLDMALLGMMKETKMTMTRKEAKQYQAELLSAQEAPLEKNILGQ